MNLYITELLEGLTETMTLHKRGEGIFDMGNHEMFPTIDSQQKWRYAKNDQNIRLSNGQNVYSFHAPEGAKQDQEFPLQRVDGTSIHDFEQGATSKGLAQVHRADPGHIYFTIQEGKDNPTYTFRHVGEDKWKGIPKAKKKKHVVEGVMPAQPEPTHTQPPMQHEHENMLPNVNPMDIKQAFLSEVIKSAGITEFGDSVVHGMLSPGRNPLLAGGIAAAGGLGYNLLKKN